MAKQHTTALSVIVTFHQEGLIAHKTMLNLKELLAPFDAQKIGYEVILHVDNGDQPTLQYLSRYTNAPHIRLFENHFGNPSDSRNFCISQAKGEYLAILDGDDIVSKSWLIDGYKMIKSSKKPLILHSAVDITFGVGEEEPRIWYISDSREQEIDTANLFTRNRWGAKVILPRDIALQFPYQPSNHGYGYEDWVFNMDTCAAGINHKVVPNSVNFYRRRPNSTYATHTGTAAVTAYSELFATERMQRLAKAFEQGKITIKSPNVSSKQVVRVLRLATRVARKVLTSVPRLGGLARKGVNYRNRRRGAKIFNELPQFIQDAWISANHIDGEAWPNPLELSRFWTYDSDYNDLTALYCRLVAQIRRNPDYLFLPPHLSVGGTEKVIVNYLTAFAKLHPDWHIVVLAALPLGHPYQIPKNVDFVDFYGLMQGRTSFEIDFILSRFIIQTRVKRLHMIHNELAFAWAKEHLALLRDNNYQLYVSQFMDEYNQDQRLVVGFVDPWLRDLAPAITKIFTDNTPFAHTIVERIGIDEEKVVAHAQPIQPLALTQPSANHGGPCRILWASRVSAQKRPDLLKAIATQLNVSDKEGFKLDVYGRIQKPYSRRFFRTTPPNVTYRGTYGGIESLDLSQYDAFLYTSQTDGLPNVLLEIASAGLPIVASNVGGVSDIVNSQTGYPVVMDDIAGYVAALKDISARPQAAQKKALAARALVESQHSWENFLAQVKRDIQ